MGSDGTSPAYRRLGATERREQLLHAALDLFAHRPPEEVSVDGVAEHAGVSRPLVYRYFPGGKEQLYEAALRSAATELEKCFDEPHVGPLTERLRRSLERYLDFVERHAAGFTALLQGGSVVETARTDAIVDGVRRQAAEQILLHLPVGEPGRRLRLAVRTWISAVEAASLIWLDEQRQPPREELRDWLLDHFVALLTATAVHDPQTAQAAERALADEHPETSASPLLRVLLAGEGLGAHLTAAAGATDGHEPSNAEA